MIEPGSEWFHVDSLTVVKAQMRYSGEGVMFVAGGCLSGSLLLESFRREFRPNVPITPELLEGMGWENTSLSGGNYNWTKHIPGIGRLNCYVYSEQYPTSIDLGINDYLSDEYHERELPTPPNGWKLRDLLNTLRCLGVQCDVPEVVAPVEKT